MRTHLLAIAFGLLVHSARAVDGIDMPGFDYANFNAESPFVCRNSCGADSRCQGWTWVKPGIQGPTGRCWLKHKLPALVKNRCCSSGPREYISPRDLKAEDHTNRPGSDYKNFEIDSWKTCETACGQDQKCRAWSYVRPGVQGNRGRCWLKHGAPYPGNDVNVVSGVKYRPPSVRID